MPYILAIRPAAQRAIEDLPREYQDLIVNKLDAISENPFAIGTRKIQGVDSGYRVRMGDYRILYQVNELEEEVKIVTIRHRREAYRNLKRLFK